MVRAYSLSLRALGLGLFFVFLFSPFFILLLNLPFQVLPWSETLAERFFSSAIYSLWISLWTTAVSLFLGVLGALGILSLKKSKWMESFYLLPSLVPQLLVVVAVLNSTELFIEFPYGTLGIVFVESLILSGLVALSFAKIIRDKMGEMLWLPRIEGASRWQTVVSGVLGYLKRDLFFLGLFVFSVVFSSFSIPYLVGDGRATLEVLIYEFIRIDLNWSAALVATAVEIGFLVFLAALFKPHSPTTRRESPRLSWLGSKGFLIVQIFILSILLVGLFANLVSGFEKLQGDPEFFVYLLGGFKGSILLGMGVGGLSFALLSLFLYLRPSKKTQWILDGFIAPSSILVGFSFLLLGDFLFLGSYAKMIIGLSLVAFPALYRLYFLPHFKALEDQILSAQILGATPLQTFKQITLPQMTEVLFFMAGLSAFWATGDFALTSILAERDFSLALIIKNLVTTYRLDLASFSLWLLLFSGIFCMSFFKGMGYVFNKKS